MGGCIHFMFVYQQIMQRLNILNFNVNDLDGGGIQLIQPVSFWGDN